MSQLYIVATPIGNLGDMTFRAVESLKSVNFVIAEDTRKSKILFDRYEIQKPMTAFHAQSSPAQAQKLAEKIATEGPAAYISEAGTPCVSDPGYGLIRAVLEHGDIDIIPIPGASALTTLLSVAGAPAHEFLFHGFLPHKKGRQTIIKGLQESKITNIFYESVHRFPKLLNELHEYLEADRVMVVGRELTKMHEEVFRGTVAQAQEHFGPSNIRGEFVVLIAPKNYTL